MHLSLNERLRLFTLSGELHRGAAFEKATFLKGLCTLVACMLELEVTQRA
jgi:hypothetical protein